MEDTTISANFVLDVPNTCYFQGSLISGNGVSGQVCGMSGVYVGQSVDMLNAHGLTNIYVMGNPVLSSGNLLIGVQTANADVSGQYTDPTSGLAQLPSVFQSGGVVWINSGSTGGVYQSGFTSGQAFNSGFVAFASFQRPGRYARLVFNSGFYIGTLTAGFLEQLHTTGSGGGYSPLPSSGGVNV